MPGRMRLNQRTAVITGAAGGIGRALALALARRGCHLALADIDEAGLARSAETAAAAGVRVSRHRLDVADSVAVAALPDAVLAAHPGVDLLINNAGVALWGAFEQVSADDFDWLFRINFHGVVHMTRAFLPLMRASDDARLVNLSSVFGLIAPSEQVAYAASKFAVRGFSEALRHELDGTTIGVTVVHPGGVATAISEKARQPASLSEAEIARRRERSRNLLRLPPEQAAEIIINAIERRQSRVLVGSDAWLIALLAQVAPVSYWKLMNWFMR